MLKLSQLKWTKNKDRLSFRVNDCSVFVKNVLDRYQQQLSNVIVCTNDVNRHPNNDSILSTLISLVANEHTKNFVQCNGIPEEEECALDEASKDDSEVTIKGDNNDASNLIEFSQNSDEAADAERGVEGVAVENEAANDSLVEAIENEFLPGSVLLILSVTHASSIVTVEGTCAQWFEQQEIAVLCPPESKKTPAVQ